jgi:hypothetical protein
MLLDIKSIIIIVLAIFMILYVIKQSFDIRPASQDCGVRCIAGSGPSEPFVAPTDYHYDTEYSGKVLGVEKKTLPLQTQQVYTPQGTPNSLRPEDYVNAVYPAPTISVDGSEVAPKSMFMFSQNQCSPSCCPSTYSCSGGCVCLTQAQTEFIANRGNNNTIPQYFM